MLRRNPVRAFCIGVVRAYQICVSPMLPGSCKYYPSCSQYAIDAVRQQGAARGVILTAWRLLRCNPLSNGGYDPVERQRLFAARARVEASHHATGRRALPASRGGRDFGREVRC